MFRNKKKTPSTSIVEEKGSGLALPKVHIAIDGPCGAGKSSVARSVAKELEYFYVDSGALYRAVAWIHDKYEIDNYEDLMKAFYMTPVDLTFIDGKQHTWVGDRTDVTNEIRTEKIALLASNLATRSDVRDYLTSVLRRFADNNDVVMDGRDIGTRVLPNANVKIYLTADQEIRAKRRYDEYVAKGKTVSYQHVFDSLLARDNQDMNREEWPLRKADDAVLIDNSYLTPGETVEKIIQIVRDKVGQIG